MPDDRRFDDREVGLILERVAELHRHEGDKSDARSMSQGEIEQVVTELGISRALVARAVTDLAVPGTRNRPVWWLGGKTDLMFEDVQPGHLGDRTFSRIMEVLRRSMADPGKLETAGDTRIWSTVAGTRKVFLTLVEDENHTTIRLEERMPLDARATVGIAAAMGAFFGFLTIIPLKVLVLKWLLLLLMAPMSASGGLVGWMVGRALWRRRAAAREQQLRDAFIEIRALCAAEPDPSEAS